MMCSNMAYEMNSISYWVRGVGTRVRCKGLSYEYEMICISYQVRGLGTRARVGDLSCWASQ